MSLKLEFNDIRSYHLGQADYSKDDIHGGFKRE